MWARRFVNQQTEHGRPEVALIITVKLREVVRAAGAWRSPDVGRSWAALDRHRSF